MRQPTALTSIGYPVSTLDELRQHVPAAFATRAALGVSEKYSFVPTDEIITNIMDLGWELQSAKQVGADESSRHMIRFTNPKLGLMDLVKDKVRPQIILDNSHNRGSSTLIHMGLFRLICTNGLVVAMPGMFTSIKFKHMGVDRTELQRTLSSVAEQYPKIGEHITTMQEISMNQDAREEFAIKAIARREPHMFIKDDGTIDVSAVTASTNPLEIIKPIRGEDEARNLWNVFNVVQERMIKGGYSRVSGSGRPSSVRGIVNATRNIELNKSLWSLCEEVMEVQ